MKDREEIYKRMLIQALNTLRPMPKDADVITNHLSWPCRLHDVDDKLEGLEAARENNKEQFGTLRFEIREDPKTDGCEIIIWNQEK